MCREILMSVLSYNIDSRLKTQAFTPYVPEGVGRGTNTSEHHVTSSPGVQSTHVLHGQCTHVIGGRPIAVLYEYTVT